MTHSEFFAEIKQGAVRPVYLFAGEEEHIKATALKTLRARLLPEGLEALNETVLQNPAVGDILAAAETLPMLAERRLVLVRDLALLLPGKASDNDGSAALADYLKNPPDTTCLVFYTHGAPDGRRKLTQALTAQIVHFDPLGEMELHRWIAQQLKTYGKSIASEEAALLAFTAGHALLILSQEIGKLAAYLGEREQVTRADIEAVVTPSLECTVFQLVDALVAGRQAEAFRLLRAMLERGEARLGILAMMARQHRHMLHYTLMRAAGQGDAAIQKQLGIKSFAMRRLAQQVRGLDAAALRARLDACVDADYAVKSGKLREEAALERAMFAVMG
ncbi:MAG: DNA polymerase III subunit delta [Oscillospiraceae bacterium]|jgi:DNA polymerase-3 subunit delta|nr:DNA polymerase III subunit delta [Oscillospiraceae bacterium]